MNAGRILALFLLIAAVFTDASGQLPSVVQLPSFRTFSYSGTVVVPDGGSAYLGGNRTSLSGSSRRGLSRGFGFSQGISQASVTATIIDLDEIDRHLLGATPQEFVKASQRDRAKQVDPTEEGKALVRYARRQYREGKKTAAFDTYRMAISVLRGRLRELAEAEFRRVFGSAADQSLRMASRRR
jgi:hypothetical protein